VGEWNSIEPSNKTRGKYAENHKERGLGKGIRMKLMNKIIEKETIDVNMRV
jgi:hypothetical protein